MINSNTQKIIPSSIKERIENRFAPSNQLLLTNTILENSNFSGIHFTGSTKVFKDIWKKIGNNIENYKTYPRIVGETGGKDFIIAHPSAKSKEVATAITRGAFEFQGQKCSAASRVYLPKSISEKVISHLKSDLSSISMGSPEDFKNFVSKGQYYRICKYWQEINQTIRKNLKHVNKKNKFFFKFEDINDRKKTEELFKFIGIKKNYSKIFKSFKKPVNVKYPKNFALTKKQQLVFKNVCGEEMKINGYEINDYYKVKY